MVSDGETPMSVPPGRSQSAAFDPAGYHRSSLTAGDETAGLWKFVVQFLLAFAVTFAVAASLGLPKPQVFGLIAGILAPVASYAIRRRRLKTQTEMMASLHSALHDLENDAKDLEIAQAKRNGDFDRWAKKP